MGQVLDISAHLSARQREVLLLLARGMSVGEVAGQTKVAVQTIYNWKSGDAGFRRELARLQDCLFDEGVESLRGLVHTATATLGEIMVTSEARDADRIAAARTVLQFAMSAQDGRSADVDEDDREFREVADELARLVRTGNGS